MEKVPNEMLPDAGWSTNEQPAGVPQESSAPVPENATEDCGVSTEMRNEVQGLTREDIAAMIRADAASEYADESAATVEAPHGIARTLCSELVDVEWHGAGSQGATRMTANLEEIWHAGATLEMDDPVPEGIRITIVRPPARLVAKVLYCHQNLTGYSVGVQFAQGSCWSVEQFVPGHSLNLEELTRSASGDEPLVEDDHGESKRYGSPEERLEADLLRQLPPSARGIRRPGKAMLDDLAPLIARGSLVRLRAQMAPGKA